MQTPTRLTAFERLSRLPAFRPAALKLAAIANDAESAMDDYERAFKSDAALTADLLVAANSAAFGRRGRVQDLRHALMMLGMERARALAMQIIWTGYCKKLPDNQAHHIWLHSIATALIAEAIGNRSSLPGMYTVGLLHDVGRLALLLTNGKPYATVMATEVSDMGEASELERSVCGMDHCDAGALLCRKWGLPEVFQVCSVEHHDPTGKNWKTSAGTAHLACRMAEWLGYPEVRKRHLELPPVMPQELQRCEQLQPNRLIELIQQHTALLAPAALQPASSVMDTSREV